MPKQSIDLSAVELATFNGTELDAINLNESEIWTKPSSGPPIQVAIDYESAVPGTWYNNTGTWYDLPNNVYFSLQRNMAMMGVNGKVYVGKMLREPALTSLQSYIGPQTVYTPVSSANFQDISGGQTRFYDWNGVDYFVPLAEVTTSGFVKVPSMPSNQQTEVTISQGQYGPLKDVVRIYCDSQWAVFYATFNDLNWDGILRFGGMQNTNGNLLEYANCTPWATTSGHSHPDACSSSFVKFGHNPENTPSKYRGVPCGTSYVRLTY